MPREMRKIRNLQKSGKMLRDFGASKKNVKIPRKKGVGRRISQATGYMPDDEGTRALAKGKPKPIKKRPKRK